MTREQISGANDSGANEAGAATIGPRDPEGLNIPTVYDPKAVEDKYYQFWEEGGFFRPEIDPSKEPYTIILPPPNVTGQLHIGHALNHTIQDILIRWQRMQGRPALWLPGTDHAGLATQIKVEEELRQEGLSRPDLGREKFINRVWEWKEQYGSAITNQLKKVGSSCDWSRERFTMDPGCSRAVREAFVRLYEKGLIYRGTYITNWCPDCHTALSDIEVEHEDTQGKLHFVRYPIEGEEAFITVATTRPETILGDTAVAVHPEDERYQALIGKHAVLPIVGRRIPIIADEYVDPSFGTGAVKVTPSHDPNDFEMGRRHNLPGVVVIGPRGKMTAEAGSYAVMDRYECRNALLRDLEDAGFLVKIEEHAHSIGHCQRCGTVVEPLVSEQWFVRMKPLAEPAMEAVRQGKTRFVPERFTKIYLGWLENIRDWCISRQIWWGHRIPAWYCQHCGETTVAIDNPTACSRCGSASLVQDDDALDTWFSSALWPFSTLGWPERTDDLKFFFPTSVLVTAYDIIFFWVARMMFMSLECMNEIPFHDVLIHGLVRDGQGRKMSKSLGNGVDPLDVIRDYGADTLRFTLITGNTPGNDVRFHWERIESSRNFANKIWNASRFVLMNLIDFNPVMAPGEYTLADKWILHRLNQTAADVTRLLEKYELGEAARTVYDFLWGDYCDWYIELAKPRLYNKEDRESRATAQFVLWYVLDQTLRLLHPFMPFITEALWQAIPHEGESIMVAQWPEYREELAFAEEVGRMTLIMDIIRAIRNLRAEMNVPAGKRAEVILQATTADALRTLELGQRYIAHLGLASSLSFGAAAPEKPDQAVTAVVPGVEVYLPLKGLVDVEKEIARLTKESDTTVKELERLRGKLSNQGFLAKAPADVIKKDKARLAELEGKMASVEERVAALRKL